MTGTVSARRSAGLATALGAGIIAGAAAAVVNVVIGAVAQGPLGAGDEFVPLTPAPIVMWTLIGAVVGAVGWHLLSGRPDLRRRLVPAVLIVSLVPDVLLLVDGSTPGQTTTGVLALMLMHVVTAAIVVTAYAKTMPA